MASYIATAFADNFRLARSKRLDNPAADTFDMVQMPRYAFLRDVWLFVEEAGSASDVTIGLYGGSLSSADVDYFMTATESAVGSTGWKRANIVTDFGTSDYGALPFPGYWFSAAAGMITFTAGTLQTTGQYYIFADYTIIH